MPTHPLDYGQGHHRQHGVGHEVGLCVPGVGHATERPTAVKPTAENIGENTNNSYVPVGTISSDVANSVASLNTTMQSRTQIENTTQLINY